MMVACVDSGGLNFSTGPPTWAYPGLFIDTPNRNDTLVGDKDVLIRWYKIGTVKSIDLKTNYPDGKFVSMILDTSNHGATYTWSTRDVVDGDYVIIAKATLADGEIVLSYTIPIFLRNYH